MPDTVTKLGPNDLQGCGTPAAEKRHWALAQHCPTCGTEGRPIGLTSTLALPAAERVAR